MDFHASKGHWVAELFPNCSGTSITYKTVRLKSLRQLRSSEPPRTTTLQHTAMVCNLVHIARIGIVFLWLLLTPLCICQPNVFDATDVLPAVREEPFNRPVLDSWTEVLEVTTIGADGNVIATPLNGTGPIFLVYEESFRDLLGVNASNTASLEVVAEKNYSFAHEGPVWLEDLNSMFFTSNRLGNTSDSDQYVEMWLLEVDSGNLTQLDVPVPMANGATLYGKDNVLVLSQGANTTGGALYRLDPVNKTVEPLLNNWYGLKFNSPNDVVVYPDGTILFTDPVYGFDQLFRNGPIELGAYIWMWKPGQEPTVIANNYVAPNGLAFSPDFKTLYTSDTGFFNGTGAWNPLNPHSIYAYDVQEDDDGNFKGIANQRIFFTSNVGIPDGIKVDNDGNVYTGVGDGVAVISKEGNLIGTF